jgi:hypothetical protein
LRHHVLNGIAAAATDTDDFDYGFFAVTIH